MEPGKAAFSVAPECSFIPIFPCFKLCLKEEVKMEEFLPFNSCFLAEKVFLFSLVRFSLPVVKSLLPVFILTDLFGYCVYAQSFEEDEDNEDFVENPNADA